MRDQLNQLRQDSIALMAGLKEDKALAEARTRVLGRKGDLTRILRGLKDLPPDERAAAGQLANTVKAELEQAFDRAEASLRAEAERRKLASEFVDVTLPGRRTFFGRGHILNRVTDELIEVFGGLGFQLAEGPEVELDYYNFEALNIPRDHPARDMQDTFYFSDNVVLRTHTSPVQIRTMEKHQPPVRVICPGKVYRRDADITHSPMFTQIEGLWVDKKHLFRGPQGRAYRVCPRIFRRKAETALQAEFLPVYRTLRGGRHPVRDLWRERMQDLFIHRVA